MTGCQWINIDTSNTSAIVDIVEFVNDSGNAVDDGGFIHIAMSPIRGDKNDCAYDHALWYFQSC